MLESIVFHILKKIKIPVKDGQSISARFDIKAGEGWSTCLFFAVR